MTRTNDSLRSDVLRTALHEAIAGKPARLEEALAKQSRLPGPRPNIELATAFGAEVAALPGELGPLLSRLGRDDAAPDDPRAFLPVVAAHGWAGRVRAGRELEAAWAALGELATDERRPVRLGTLEALLTLGVRDGGADELVRRAQQWWEQLPPEPRLCGAALLLEALGQPHVLATLSDEQGLLDYLSQVIEAIADAPRAAERWEGRRRALLSLPATLAATVVALRTQDRGIRWFEAEAARATHPDVRAVLSQTLGQLRRSAHAPSSTAIETLRKALEDSAKPLRDAARVRPGTGRGRRSRQTR
ncbi:MAG TPA: hypothetical protein VF331_27605 [Polyangiales bacterium]